MTIPKSVKLHNLRQKLHSRRALENPAYAARILARIQRVEAIPKPPVEAPIGLW